MYIFFEPDFIATIKHACVALLYVLIFTHQCEATSQSTDCINAEKLLFAPLYSNP